MVVGVSPKFRTENIDNLPRRSSPHVRTSVPADVAIRPGGVTGAFTFRQAT
jgi:hypothetical protein